MICNNFMNVRKKVAREAANLLYCGVEKEYKQAKLNAAETYGVHFLPTNCEVAIEFDKIAEENEGAARKKHLILMRKKALKLMKLLKAYDPVLVGSVWRGTIHHRSDIDIALHHEEQEDILEVLRQNNLKIARTEWTTVTKGELKTTPFHIYIELPKCEKVEIIVNRPENNDHTKRCDIYGDTITGLRIRELEKVIEENPSQRFVPI